MNGATKEYVGPWKTNPPKVVLGEPVRVSPFIRFCRWGLLFAGIGWGIHRQRVLSRKETEHRRQLRIKKAEWDKEQAVAKQINNRNELLYLAKETNTPVPTNFDEQYPLPTQGQ